MNRMGLARNTRWTCEVFPPKGLSAAKTTLDTGKSTINVPGLDALDDAIRKVNNAKLDFAGIKLQSNLGLPTLGYKINKTGTMMDAINLYCQSVVLPEREVLTSEWREHGESRSFGIVHSHKPVTITYFCSEDMRERLFFEQWQDIIFNSGSKRRGFYDEYISTIEISKYNASWTDMTSRYRFNEAYPINIAAQTLVYEGTSILRLDVTFKYRNYERIE